MPGAASERPLISANFALTWDGRISTRSRSPSDFSSRADKRRLLEIRARADAVLITARTARIDGMAMGLPSARLRAERRARGQAEYPMRVLVSRSGQVPADLPMLHKPGGPVVVFTTSRMPAETRRALAPRARLLIQPGETPDLPALVRTLQAEFHVQHLHCEGGGELLRALAEAGLIDELYLTLCPRIFGSREAPTLTGSSLAHLPQSIPWRLLESEIIGDECFCHYQRLP